MTRSTRSSRKKSLLYTLRRWRTPRFRQETDYLKLVAPPERLVGPDGRYRAGWYPHFDGELNVTDADTGGRRFQRWFHLHFDSERYFIVSNIAHLNLGGNVALLVLDKDTGEFFEAAETRMLWRNGITVDANCRRFDDAHTGSWVELSPDEQTVRFRIACAKLSFEGVAHAVFERPYVQCTRYHRGNGSLQWWGNLAIETAHLVLNGSRVELPEGTLGGYDRTIGHRRPVQNWNWVATIGRGVDAETGAPVSYALSAATDQALALPIANAAKNSLWIDGVHYKLPELSFDYEITDAERWDTGHWRLTCSSGQEAIDLVIEPRFRRREQKQTPLLYDVDFNQYYGELRGRVRAGGREVVIHEGFALAEDAWLVM